MAFDTFIKIDGIEGESTDDKHAGWIEVASFTGGLTQRTSATASSAGGGSAERADFHDFSFTKQLDKATPKLAIACADGTHIDSVLVEVCRAGTEKVKFMEIKMSNCIISNATISGGESEKQAKSEFPKESISINYGKIEWAYTVQKRQGGGPAGNVAGGWDLQKNCKV